MSLTLRRYFGTHRDGRARMGEARTFISDRGFLDDGRPFLAVNRSNRVWMAGGPGGEALLHRIHLITVYTVRAQVRITPIVDDREITEAAVVVDLIPTANRIRPTVSTIEVDVKEPLSDTRATRRGVRGAAAQVQVEFFGVQTASAPDYILSADECHLEVEVVRSSVPTAAAVPR